MKINDHSAGEARLLSGKDIRVLRRSTSSEGEWLARRRWSILFPFSSKYLKL